MSIYYKFPAALFIGSVLSACGGTNNDRAPTVQPLPDPVVTSERIQSGEAITASHVAGLRLDYGRDVVAGASGDTLAFQKTGDGTYQATLNGKAYTFTDANRTAESDGKVYTMQNNDPDIGFYSAIWHQTGELDDVLKDGTSYANVFGVHISDHDVDVDNDARIFAVVGAQTPDADLPVDATVTYTGRGDIQAFPKVGFDDVQSSRERYRGDLRINADFAAAKVDGSITNLTEQLAGSSDQNPIAGTVLLNQTNLTGGTFAGTVGIVGTENLDIDNAGTYSGGFFGPQASETAGVLSLDGDEAVANGYFTGTKN